MPTTGETVRWRLFWLIVAAILFVLLLVWLGWQLSGILMPFVLAGLAAYAFNPFIDHMEKRGWSRSFTVLALMLLVLCLIILAGALITPRLAAEISDLIKNYDPLVAQAKSLYESSVETLQSSLPWLEGGVEISTYIKNKGAEYTQNIITKIPALLGKFLQGIFGLGYLLVITAILAYWMLKDYHRIARRLVSLLPAAYADRVGSLGRQVNQLISAYLLGIFLLCIVAAVLAAALLFGFRVPYALLLGLLVGIGYVIPYFGMPIATVITAIVAAATGQSWTNIAIIIASLIALNFILDYIVSPRVVGERVGLHPVTVIFALLAAGQLFGFIGILIALPLAAAIRAALATFFPQLFGVETASQPPPTPEIPAKPPPDAAAGT